MHNNNLTLFANPETRK